MSPELSGLRVWITRPGPAAQRSASRFEEGGAVCLVAPALSLEPRTLGVEDRHRLLRFLPEARLVLTSANAALYLVESLVGDGHLLDAVKGMPVSAVGEATARAASELGFRVDHLASVALGVELARELGEETERARVVLPGSDLRRQETESQLLEHGVEVLPLTVYRTLPITTLSEEIAVALRAGELDAIAVYSPSAVRGVIGAGEDAGIRASGLPALLALGPSTAAECRELGHAAEVAPEQPGEPALLEAVARWWKKRSATR